MYLDKLAGIAYEYNKKYHSTMKGNPLDVKLSSYLDFDVENSTGVPKFLSWWSCRNIEI